VRGRKREREKVGQSEREAGPAEEKVRVPERE